MNESDEVLMGRAKSGDEQAFSMLVRRHEAAIRRYCSAVLRDRAQAWDAAQETFLDIWRARERYEERGMFKQYLFTAAKNRCRKAKARAWLRWLVPDEGVAQSRAKAGEPSAAEALELRQMDHVVERAVAELPEHFRVPLLLRYGEELDYAAIGEIIGKTESTARSRVFYALKALSQRLPAEVIP